MRKSRPDPVHAFGIDSHLAESDHIKALQNYHGGWIRSTRRALGWAFSDLAETLAISKQALSQLEEREEAGVIARCLGRTSALASVLVIVGLTNTMKRYWVEAVLFSVTLVSRVGLLPSAPAEWDSAQLALGVRHFDVRVHSPHPPGYWLYVVLGRAINAVTPLDPSQSLTLISGVASAFVAVMAFRVALKFGDRWLALVFSALVVANPFVWFYGLTANVYIFDLLFALILMDFAFRQTVGSREVVIVAISMGVMAGIRQSVIYIFGPLAIYVVVRARPPVKVLLVSLAGGLVVILAWLVPASLEQSGGFRVLYDSTSSMWRYAAQHSSVLAGASRQEVRTNVGKATTTAMIASLLAVLVSLAVWILALLTRKVSALGRFRTDDRVIVRDGAAGGEAGVGSPSARQTLVVLILLAVPSILVTTLGHFGKTGYVLAYMPAVLLPCCLSVTQLRRAVRPVGLIALAIVPVIWALQFTRSDHLVPDRFVNSGPWFLSEEFGVPFKTYTLDTIRMYDRDTKQYRALADVAEPNDTFVYYGDEGVERFRKMSLVLPDLMHELVQSNPQTPCTIAYKGRLHDCHLAPIRAYYVRPGGRALFVANAPNDDMKHLVQEGRAHAVALSTGPTVFVVLPGTVVNGQPVLEDPALSDKLKSNYT